MHHRSTERRTDPVDGALGVESVSSEMLPCLIDGHFRGKRCSLDERERQNVAKLADRIRVPPSQEKVRRSGFDRRQRFFNGVDESGYSRLDARQAGDLRPGGHFASPDAEEGRLGAGERIDRVGPVVTRDERQLPSGHTILVKSKGTCRTRHVSRGTGSSTIAGHGHEADGVGRDTVRIGQGFDLDRGRSLTTPALRPSFSDGLDWSRPNECDHGHVVAFSSTTAYASSSALPTSLVSNAGSSQRSLANSG